MLHNNIQLNELEGGRSNKLFLLLDMTREDNNDNFGKKFMMRVMTECRVHNQNQGGNKDK